MELLLHIEIADIEYPEKEKIFKSGYDSHGIRVDVFVKDSDRIFDIEMQTSRFENLPMRARYYQSIMDVETLDKGTDYAELKESDKIYNDKSHKMFYTAHRAKHGEYENFLA